MTIRIRWRDMERFTREWGPLTFDPETGVSFESFPGTASHYDADAPESVWCERDPLAAAFLCNPEAQDRFEVVEADDGPVPPPAPPTPPPPLPRPAEDDLPLDVGTDDDGEPRIDPGAVARATVAPAAAEKPQASATAHRVPSDPRPRQAGRRK